MNKQCKNCGKELKKNLLKKGFDKNLCFLCNKMNEICKDFEININGKWLVNTKSKKFIKISWVYK
jgi:hypothetical protein